DAARPGAGAGGCRFHRARRRVRRDRRAVRLREVDAAENPRRPAPRHSWRGDASERARERSAPRHRRRVPVSGPLSLAKRGRQRVAPHRRSAARPGRQPFARARSPRARGTARIRASLSLGAVRRDAAAGRDHARSHPQPGDAVDGRTVRRAGCDDARHPQPRAAADLARTARDDPLHHAFHRGSRLPRRSRVRHDAAARAHHRADRGADSAAALAGSHRGPGVRADRPQDPPPLRTERRGGCMRSLRDAALRLLLLVASLGLWEAAVRALRVPAFILPPPSEIGAALYRGAVSGIYLRHLWITLAETLLGFALGSAVAFILGTALAMCRRAEYFLYPFIVMFQSMPKVALAPLVVVWFGLGITSKVVSAALIAFFPLLVNTIVGLRSADEDRVDLMRSLGATQLQIFWMLRLPSALSFI